MSNSNKRLTYADSGVSIDEGNSFVNQIKPLIKKTQRPEVLSPLGGYAGLFQLDLQKYPQPVLVSSTDGVGTKLKLAFQLQKFDTVGIDLVAMCVNDLICCGAEPLFFLDYYATGKLKSDIASLVVKGMTNALSSINCTLLGGETAEMPGMYTDEEFDLAGFSVGVVNKDKMIDGSTIQEGDTLIGLTSSGVHSNGFSLVRKIAEQNQISLSSETFDLDRPLGEILLTPTRLYVNEVLNLQNQIPVKGIAHITGGGLIENVPRILPNHLAAQFEKSLIPTPRIFRLLQELGHVPEEEMWRVFNMGIGLVLVVPETETAHALDILPDDARVIGKIMTKEKEGTLIV